MDWLGFSTARASDNHVRLTVNAPDLTQLLTDIESRLKKRAGFSLATLNLDHLVKLRHDSAFRAAYLAHSHVTADGNPIVALGRLAKENLSLVPGSDLIMPVTRIAARCGAPVALLGSTPATLDRAATRMTGAFPGLQICAQIAPPMGFDPQSAAADDLIDRLIETKAQVCFLALGAPKQEIFAARAQSRAPGIGFISIGAGLDFIAGTQTRAPRWVRAIAAEWLWRLVHDPRRLAMRYAACFAILPGLTLAALRARAQPSAKGSTPV